MSRKTVRVAMPRGNPAQLIGLARKVYSKHIAMGKDSPLKTLNMEGFIQRAGQAEELYDEAKGLHARAEALMMQLRTLLGLEAGQTMSDRNATLAHLALIRDSLLLTYKGLEENLSEFGFNVVIGQASSRPKGDTGSPPGS